jgi:hypothetical protein
MHETPQSASEHDDELIERYLRGDLDGLERDAFEMRLLDEPDLLQRSEGLARMRDSLRQHGVDAVPRRALWPDLRAAFADLFRRPGYALALATSVALAVGLTFAALSPGLRDARAALASANAERDTLRDRVASLSAARMPVVFEMPTLRGGDTAPDLTIVVPAGAATVGLVLPLADDAGDTNVTVHDANDRVVFSDPQARANLRGGVLLMLPGDKLVPGDYRVATETAFARTVYRLRVVASSG